MIGRLEGFVKQSNIIPIKIPETQMMKASLSSHFGIPIDAVDVVMTDDAGNLRMRYATIFLTERDVRRITGQQHGG